ncbi:MAG: PorT family protein [Cytophagaceae bacterium]|nr:PorT family protein [Cytophagaceae bacterium]
MQKLSKISLLVIALLSAYSAAAQIRFGVKGGLNSSTFLISNNQFGYEPKALPNGRLAWQAGLLADVGIHRNFSVQPAVLLSSKGFQSTYDAGNGISIKYTYEPLYVEIPVLALAKINLGDTFRIYAGVGPYVAVGVGGKYTASGLGDSKTDITFGNTNAADLKRIDYGGSVALGVEFGKLIVGVNYNRGLANILAEDSDVKIRNASLGLTVGFLLGDVNR